MTTDRAIPSLGLSLQVTILALALTVAFACGETVRAAALASIPSDAVVSPDGEHAVWAKADASGFWLVERSSPSENWSQPEQLTLRGVVRRPVFSPDGRRFAFENARGGYSTQDPNFWGPNRAYTWGYIGVFDLSTKRISYLNPSFAEDINPQWRDNDSISYTRRTEGLPDVSLNEPVSPRPALLSVGASKNKALLGALLEAPLAYQPVQATDGLSLAFVARSGRERAIYFMRIGEAARALVSYAQDDGQELSQLTVAPQGGLVAYARGSQPNGKTEIANPHSLNEPPQRQIWLVSTAGTSRPRLLGVGDAPQFSPAGDRLVWLTPQGVASISLSTQNGQPAVGSVETILAGELSHLRFSPDGKSVVFERSSYVEIFDLQTRAKWAIAKPNDATDADPAWSPDGRMIAFRRVWGPQPKTNVGYGGEYVAKEPWAICSANQATHEVHQVWRAAPGVGSAYYGPDQDPTDTGVASDDLLWSGNHDIGFVWEGDGWRHLYAVSADGGQARLLTPGDGDVEQSAVSFDHQHLVYTTNIGDMPRRHLSRVAFSGGAPQALNMSEISQWAPTPLAGGRVAFVEGGWKTPPAVMIEDLNGNIVSAGVPSVSKSFPASKMVKPQPVTFPGVDGQIAYGQLFIPSNPSGCGIIFVHGGIVRQMLPGFHYREAYSNLYELNQYLTIRGCAVLSVEYRSSIMRGYAFRNAPGWGNAGASEYKDVLGGANYLKSRADLHVRSVGIYGLSWGGYLTAQALARNSDVFQVGFDMAGVHEFPAATFKYSPAAFAEQWRSPVYIAAGDDDRNVDFNQSITLIRALQRNAPKVELVEKVIPNETHDLSLTFEDLLDVYWNGSEFMLEHLNHGR